MTTVDLLARHAAERPHAPALIIGGRAVTYAQFRTDLDKFTAALLEFELPRGAWAAVACEDTYVHWLVLLACERLGIATESLAGGGFPAEAGPAADLVLAAPGTGSIPGGRHQALSAEWLERVFAREGGADGLGASSPDDRLRILHSSGTTGSPKRFVLTRRMRDARADLFTAALGFTPASRYLLSVPLHAAVVYAAAIACLRAGGTVVAQFAGGKLDLAHASAAHRVTTVSMFPILLKQALDELPADFVKPARLAVHSIAAAISDALCERAVARLATEFFCGYGCNETGPVCVARTPAAGGFHAVLPQVEVEIVDDEGRPAPRGTAGRIKLKTPGMIADYPDDPAATRRHFRDGWFYPEDIGVLNDAGQLKVIGRADEVINVGGQKIAPAEIEDLMLRETRAADAGMCSFPNADGIEELYVAVAAPQGSIEAIGREVGAAFSALAFGNVYVLRLDGIPRNAGGKIDRARLKAAVTAARAKA